MRKKKKKHKKHTPELSRKINEHMSTTVSTEETKTKELQSDFLVAFTPLHSLVLLMLAALAVANMPRLRG